MKKQVKTGLHTILGAASLLLFAVTAPTFALEDSAEIRIENPTDDSVILAATLTLPEGEAPFPGVVLVTGSGPQDRDSHDPSFGEHRPFAVWADHLAGQGFAVLRYDDRGTAASTGDFAAATAADLASDAQAALAQLRQSPFVDAERTGFIGHSEGGAVAMMAAAATDADFVVMLAGPAVDFREVFSGQYLAQQIAGADTQAAIDANQAFLSTIYATLDEVADAPHAPARAHLAAAFDAMGLPHEAGLDMLSSDYMRGWVAYDMRAGIRAFNGPVLGVYGEHDLSVDAVQNAAALGGLIDPRDGSAVRVLLGKNHLFQTVDGPMANPAEQDHAIAPDVLDLVTAWLTERTDLATSNAGRE